MARIYGYYEHPDDLTPGRSKEGGIHQNLYDGEGRLADHGTFFPDDGEPRSVDGGPSASTDADDLNLEGVLGALVLLGAMVALERAKPHVKKWWSDQALPAMRSTWHRLARARRSGTPAPGSELSVAAGGVAAETAREVTEALEGYRTSMSSAEARERLAAALVARMLSDEQMRILREARIEDGHPMELGGAIDRLTPEDVAGGIALMLEANPSLLDDVRLAELGKTIGRGPADGEAVLWGRKEIDHARRLTTGEA